MSKQKKLPTRRDRREAIGYLEDLFDTGNEGDTSHEVIAERLVDSAVEVKVQRATDRLVLYFDLEDDGTEHLPEVETDADGNDVGGERVSGGLSEFQPDGSDNA